MERPSRCVVALLGVLLPAIVATAAEPAAPAKVWQLTPYRVQLLVAVAPEIPAAARLQAELLAELAARANAVVGGAWDVTAAAATGPLSELMLRDLDAVDAALLPQGSPEPDKTLLVAVTPAGSGFTVIARDFDGRTQVWNAAAGLPAPQRAKIAAVALRALVQGFAPVAIVESASQQNAALWPKAAAIPPRAKDVTLLRSGEAFRAVVRVNDKTGAATSLTPIAQTVLVAEKLDGPEVQARVEGAAAGQVSGRNSKLVEPLAVAILPARRTTTLVFPTTPKQPLPVYDVYRLVDGKPQEMVGRTDRGPRVEIPADSAALEIIEIRLGDQPQLRLPVVPGAEKEIAVPLAGSLVRVEVEGAAAALSDDLLDQVARREALMNLIRTRIAAGKLSSAEAALGELRALPPRDHFVQAINREQKRLAGRSEDPAVQKHLETTFGELLKVIEKHLDPAPVAKVGAEFAAAKDAAAKKKKPAP